MSDPNRKAEKAAAKAAREARYDAFISTLADKGIVFEEFPKIARLNREIIVTEKIDGTNAAIRVVTKVPDFSGTAVHKDGHVTHLMRELAEPIVVAQSRTRILTVEEDNFGFAAWVQVHSRELAMALGEGIHYGEWWGKGIQRGYGLDHKVFSLFNTYKWVVRDGHTYDCFPTETNPNGKYTHSGSDKIHPDIEALKRLGINIDVVPCIYWGPMTGPAGFVDENEKRLISLEELFRCAIEGEFDYDEVIALAKDSCRMRFMPHLQAELLRRHGSFAAPGYMKPEGIVVYHLAAGTAFKMTLENDDKGKGEV